MLKERSVFKLERSNDSTENALFDSIGRYSRYTSYISIVSKDRERKVKLISRQVVLGAMLHRQKLAGRLSEITWTVRLNDLDDIDCHWSCTLFPFIGRSPRDKRASKHRYPRSTATIGHDYRDRARADRAVVSARYELAQREIFAQREILPFVLVGSQLIVASSSVKTLLRNRPRTYL